jgi:hypothetical protein
MVSRAAQSASNETEMMHVFSIWHIIHTIEMASRQFSNNHKGCLTEQWMLVPKKRP